MNIDSPSITKFGQLVELKDFKGPSKKEYVRYVRRLSEHFQSDPATLFKYRQSDTGRWKLLTLDTPEFLRRFLQHVLPTGFHRVRYYGWWSPAAKEKWARILALLDWREPARPPKRAPWAMTCPCCGKPMTRLGLVLPCRPP